MNQAFDEVRVTAKAGYLDTRILRRTATRIRRVIDRHSLQGRNNFRHPSVAVVASYCRWFVRADVGDAHLLDFVPHPNAYRVQRKRAELAQAKLGQRVKRMEAQTLGYLSETEHKILGVEQVDRKNKRHVQPVRVGKV